MSETSAQAEIDQTRMRLVTFAPMVADSCRPPRCRRARNWTGFRLGPMVHGKKCIAGKHFILEMQEYLELLQQGLNDPPEQGPLGVGSHDLAPGSSCCSPLPDGALNNG